MKPPIFHRVFSYDKNMLPNRFLASLEEGVTTLKEARDRTGATIGYPGWGLIYHVLLSHLNPAGDEIIIETGTNWGSTSIILAQALENVGCSGRVITFELDADNVERATRNIAAAGLAGRVDVVAGDSRVNLPRVLAESCAPRSIRTAFLDASHLENDLIAEFESVLPYLADDAVVIMDNTYAIAGPDEDQRVNGALKKFPGRFGGNLINFEHVSWFTPGLAIWQKTPKL